jgi:hypothetical protein
MLALAAVPGLVLVVPLLILEALNVEQGPLVAVRSCCCSWAA